MFRALGNRTFLLFFAGHAFSVLGSILQSVALSWVTYQLTGSALLLTLVMALCTLPTLFVSPFAGVLVDRCDIRRVMIITQVLLAAQATLLFGLSVSGWLAIEWLIVLSIFYGVVMSVDLAARQVFNAKLVNTPQELMSALSLSAMTGYCARFIGPLISTALLAGSAGYACFGLNALSYVPNLILLVFFMPRTHRRAPRQHAVQAENTSELLSCLACMREGFTSIQDHRRVFKSVLIASVVAMFVSPFIALLPVVSVEILEGGEQIFGLLMSAYGLGALAGLVMMNNITPEKMPPRIVAYAVAQALGLVALSVSSNPFISMLIVFGMSFAGIFTGTGVAAYLQINMPPELRGRVMGIFNMATSGVCALWMPVTGFLTQKIGVGNTFMVMAALACAGLVAISRQQRRQRAGFAGQWAPVKTGSETA